MIPKEAIEKAIKGGWHDKDVDTTDTEWLSKDGWRQRIALDPLFWQALGKALGWSEVQEDERYIDYPSPMWKHMALSHTILILTQQDTQAFWDKVLAK